MLELVYKRASERKVSDLELMKLLGISRSAYYYRKKRGKFAVFELELMIKFLDLRVVVVPYENIL
jgi:predicted transcriptional regulator